MTDLDVRKACMNWRDSICRIDGEPCGEVCSQYVSFGGKGVKTAYDFTIPKVAGTTKGFTTTQHTLGAKKEKRVVFKPMEPQPGETRSELIHRGFTKGNDPVAAAKERERIAQREYGGTYISLTKEQRKAIDERVPPVPASVAPKEERPAERTETHETGWF